MDYSSRTMTMHNFAHTHTNAQCAHARTHAQSVISALVCGYVKCYQNNKRLMSRGLRLSRNRKFEVQIKANIVSKCGNRIVKTER